jgi:WhiB family transcriptional regulator, redox-sensing transcriptional regulator
MPHAAAYYDERAAKQICKACPLIMQCLEFAISNHELGIWGGTTERDRQRLRSSMRRAPLDQTRSKL